MNKITITLDSDDMESVLDALEHAEEYELFNRLEVQFAEWMNEMDADGVYVNRKQETE